MRHALLITSAIIAWCSLAPVTTAAAGPASFCAAQKALVGQYFGFSTWIGFNPGKTYGTVLLYNTGGVSPKEAGLKIIRQTA